MSSTTIADLVIRQGSGYQAKFVYCAAVPNSVPPAPDTTAPVNVTGWSARMQIRAGVDGPVLAEAATADGSITVGGINGTFTVTLTGAQTAALTRDGVYDLLAKAGTMGAQPERVAQGAVSIERAVTPVI